MRHERFTASPFDEVALTMGDRSQLEALAQTFVSDNLRQYLAHSAMGLDKVDARRWKVVKAKEALRVYSERSQRDMARRTRKHATETRTEEEESGDYLVSELPVMFSAGTLVGDLEEVMFGVVNPSLELMRIKSSFFRQTSPDAVEHYSSGTIDPGGAIPRSILKRDERRLEGGVPKLQTPEHVCVTCRSKTGHLFGTKCRICLGDLCMSCSIKKRLSFLSPSRSLVRHKVSVCTSCMVESLHTSAAKAARDQLLGPSTCSVFATCSMSETSSNLSASSTALSRSRCPKTTV
ncbi:hypothetical protein KRP22_004825 [Phytophthora ramorum]|nr:hypothetical protein KRP22_10457 [Phytophthora ramorum]